MASAIDFPMPDCFGRPTCDPAPACPACGGLECLCRPRFFAGQLLTEDDLNRLDHYIQAKNRLHNRYLHGWGVACGLEVVCGVCEPDQRHVIVKPGYALSPCGNDIVVCQSTSVDICDLISRCRPPADDCYDLIGTPAPVPSPTNIQGGTGPAAGNDDGTTLGDCGGGTEEWVLAVCYTEKPSRGVAALRATPGDCGCGCGGGKKADGGCACGGHGAASTTSGAGASGGCGCGGSSRARKAATPRSVPEQCEPTVTCESGQFVVYKAPKPALRQKQFGAAARRFLCCMAPLLRDVSDASNVTSAAEAQNWALAISDGVREFITTEGLYDCRLARRLSAISIPSQGQETTAVYLGRVSESVASIVAVAAIAWQRCLCAALLPPCPEPSPSDCVPLATITVSRSSCCVMNICNLSARKFLVTIPNIEYWFSFIDLATGSTTTVGGVLRGLLERLCCRPARDYQTSVKGANFFQAALQTRGRARASARQTVSGAAPAEAPSAVTTLFEALASPDRHVGVEHLLLAALGAVTAEGKPFVSDEEIVNPANFILLNEIVAPLLRSLTSSETSAAAVASVFTGAVRAKSPDNTRLDELDKQLASLKTTVSRQEKTIAQLKKNK